MGFVEVSVITICAANADISGVVLCVLNFKCDWTNAYSLNLKNNDC